MNDDGEGIAQFAVKQNIQLDQLALAVSLELIVEAGVAPASALNLVKELKDDFIQGNFVNQLDASTLVLHVDEDATLVHTDVHHRAHELLGRIEGAGDVWLFHARNLARGRKVGGIVDGKLRPVGFKHMVDNAGRGGDQVQVKLPLQPLLDDLHVQ